MGIARGWLGRQIARIITRPVREYRSFTTNSPEILASVLQPGDVLLVEGNQWISEAIKYLTQSTWSHAALYVGDAGPGVSAAGEALSLVEADLEKGVHAVPLSKYASFNTRICRAVGMTDEDRARVVRYVLDRLGHEYDLRNVLDLMRYLFPTPPVPVRWRRQLLAMGSGAPTRAICSTLIAQAFQSVRYPILPNIRVVEEGDPADPAHYTRKTILHIRHYSLFTPRDFDVSPWFRIVKPTIERGFDYRGLIWQDGGQPADEGGPA